MLLTYRQFPESLGVALPAPLRPVRRVLGISLFGVFVLVANLVVATPASAEDPLYQVAGRVSLDVAGGYAAEDEVRVTAQNGDKTVTAMTDPEGRYDLGRLRGGANGWQIEYTYLGADEYPRWYYAGDARGSRTPGYRLRPIEDRTDYDVIVGAGVSFSGVLRDSSGSPVEGEPVRIVGRQPLGGMDFSTTTAQDGSYRVRGLPNGWSYRVVWGAGYFDDVVFGSPSSDFVQPGFDEWLSDQDGTVLAAPSLTVEVSWPSWLNDQIARPSRVRVLLERFDAVTSAWGPSSAIGYISLTEYRVQAPPELPPGRYRVGAEYQTDGSPDEIPPFDPAWSDPLDVAEGEDAFVRLAIASPVTSVAISRLHSQLGGDLGELGPAQGGVTGAGDGARQRFRSGWILSHPDYGTWAVMDGVLANAYWAAGGFAGSIGWPIGSTNCEGARCWQRFTNAIVTTTPQYGAHVIWGGLAAHWWDTKGFAGIYGAAVSDMSYIAGPYGVGWQQNFEAGVVVQTGGGFFFVPYSQVLSGWLAQGGGAGWLGWPVGAPWKNGSTWAQPFDGGVVTSGPYGPQVVSGGFIEEWRTRGGLGGELDLAYGPLRYLPGAQPGWAQNFAGGILTQSASGFSLVPYGQIQALWSATGESRTFGWPRGGQSCTALGCSQEFTAAILTSSSWGAFPIVGGFQSYWSANAGAATMGPAANALRYSAASGGGWAQHFATGVVTQAVGGAPIFTPYGPILDMWYHYGAEATWLGWPLAAPVCEAGSCIQKFQHGVARSTAAGEVSFAAE